MVGFGLGKNLLFKSVLGHCDRLIQGLPGVSISTSIISYWYAQYGNTGSGVFKRGGTKLERFLTKNQHKGNYCILSFRLMASCQKEPKFDNFLIQ